MSKKILLVMLDFDSWTFARHWSYNASYAFADGMEENGHSCTILPALYNSNMKSGSGPDKFLDNVDAILSDQQFDEAWVWCVHKEYSEHFWMWLAGVAAIRIGFVMESMNFHDDAEIIQFPHLIERKRTVLAQLQHCTHAIVVDENDAPLIQTECSIPAVWFPAMISEQFVRYDEAPKATHAFFIGSAYAVRKPYLEDPLVKTLLIRPKLPEYNSGWPEALDELHANWRALLEKALPTIAQLNEFTHQLRNYRRILFEIAQDGIRLGFANVNLPSIVRAYPARITEAMASATPAVTYLLKAREKCAALFVENEDLMVFDSPKTLYSVLKKLREEDEWRNQITIAARNKLLTRHTSSIRMNQYRQWIDHNIQPDFFEDPTKSHKIE